MSIAPSLTVAALSNYDTFAVAYSGDISPHYFWFYVWSQPLLLWKSTKML